MNYSYDHKKSNEIGLSFPYDWSNPNIPDDALILNVLHRGDFDDVCRIVIYYGFDRVNELSSIIQDEIASRSILRMMRNINRSIQYGKN